MFARRSPAGQTPSWWEAPLPKRMKRRDAVIIGAWRLRMRISLAGTRIRVGATGSLKQILFGPAEVDDGSQNLVGAITTCMGNVGARDLAEFQQTEIIIAPSIKTEGKLFQTVQNVGMGTR
jgi:hypothetical protein